MAPLALRARCRAPSLRAAIRPIKVISFTGLQRIAQPLHRHRPATLQQNREQKSRMSLWARIGRKRK